MEALAMSVPVICLDICGFHDVIDDRSGVRIDPGSFELAAAACASALQRLSTDVALRRTLSTGAVSRVEDVSWTIKAARMNDVYLRALGR